MVVEAKICGLTLPDDAAAAALLGAQWLGVIFAGGPRMIDAARAREIVSAANGTPVLGVFGHQALEVILETCAEAGLAGAQLHGEYTASDAAMIREAGLLVWRIAAVAPGIDIERAVNVANEHADAVVIEAAIPGGAGGKGIMVDATAARRARAAVRARAVLAGGLTDDNVHDAIQRVLPDVVDVSSGVEQAPGVKDHARMARFLEIARGVHASA